MSQSVRELLGLTEVDGSNGSENTEATEAEAMMSTTCQPIG